MEAGFLFFYGLAGQSPLVDGIVVFFASTFPYIVIFSAFAFLLRHHEIFEAERPAYALLVKWREIFGVFFASFGAWILARVLKILISADRPMVESLFLDSSHSFPSGHATFFSTLAILIYFRHKKAGIFFGICALAISLARVMAGVHFPIDILGGFLLGFIVAYLFKKL